MNETTCTRGVNYSLVLMTMSYRVFIKYCVFFPNFSKYSELCFPTVSVCVYTYQAGRKPALQQNWQSSEKSQNYKEKHNI